MIHFFLIVFESTRQQQGYKIRDFTPRNKRDFLETVAEKALKRNTSEISADYDCCDLSNNNCRRIFLSGLVSG